MTQRIVLLVLFAVSFQGYVTANQQDALTRLSDIAVNLVNIVGDKGEIKTDMADMATLLSTLTKEAIDLENPKPDDLDTRLQKMKCSIQNLTAQQKSTQEAAKVQKDQTDSSMENILRRLSDSERKIQQLEERLAENESNEVQPFAGFTAWSDLDETFSKGETVQFNQVLFNYGSAYDSSTSKFTCPFSGIYFVTVHVQDNASGGFSIEAMLDSSRLFNMYVYYTNYETSSTSAMVGCLTGQTIYIKASSNNVVKLFNSSQKCIFSVHLIQPMSESEVTSGRLF